MVAVFEWVEANGVGETESTPTNLNFGSVDSVNLDTLTYPVTASENSYEKYIKVKFTGTFSVIDNLQFWKSAGDYVTGESILWNGETPLASYAQPTASTSSVALVAVPTADPGTANVSIGSSLSGTITVSGDTSDYIVLQLQTTGSIGPGAVNQKTFTIQYDEV